MIYQDAKEKLIVKLAEDLSYSLSDKAYKISFCRTGFKGYDNMSIEELLCAADDAGIEDIDEIFRN